MGTIYYIACNECRVKRDLDKLRWAHPVENRAAALEQAEQISKGGSGGVLRHAMLASFLFEHMGHSCTFFNDNCDYEQDKFPQDKDMWSTSEEAHKEWEGQRAEDAAALTHPQT
jgi:hypothetical protein